MNFSKKLDEIFFFVIVVIVYFVVVGAVASIFDSPASYCDPMYRDCY